MTYIVFSFDTEDYVNEAAADGILYCAEILRKHGVRGCFQVVGRLAEALVEWGREDVIEALKYHEIDTHSLAHSYHPTINEYTDLEDYEAAKAEFLKRECASRDILFRTFGINKLHAACPPGSSVSYVAHYGYAEMGIPVYCGDHLIDPVRGRNVYNCNVLSTDYHRYLDRFFMKRTNEEVDEWFEKVAAEKDVYVLAHHPQKGLFEEYCDILNFNGENVPKDQWKLSTPLPEEKIKRHYEGLEYLVKKLKADPRFKIVTYEELGEIYCKDERVLTPADIPALKAQLDEYFFPVTTPDSYCIADVLLACRDFLLGKQSHTCGNVYGFLDTPYTITEPVTLSAEELRASAAQVGDYFLATEVKVGDKRLGMGDWLRAAMAVLCGAHTVTVEPATWQIDMDQFPQVRDQVLSDGWIHCKSFRDNYLSHRARLQSWTFRLPRGTARKIFE